MPLHREAPAIALVLAIAGALAVGPVRAEPFVPARDDDVLEVLPTPPRQHGPRAPRPARRARRTVQVTSRRPRASRGAISSSRAPARTRASWLGRGRALALAGAEPSRPTRASAARVDSAPAPPRVRRRARDLARSSRVDPRDPAGLARRGHVHRRAASRAPQRRAARRCSARRTRAGGRELPRGSGELRGGRRARPRLAARCAGRGGRREPRGARFGLAHPRRGRAAARRRGGGGTGVLRGARGRARRAGPPRRYADLLIERAGRTSWRSYATGRRTTASSFDSHSPDAARALRAGGASRLLRARFEARPLPARRVLHQGEEARFQLELEGEAPRRSGWPGRTSRAARAPRCAHPPGGGARGGSARGREPALTWLRAHRSPGRRPSPASLHGWGPSGGGCMAWLLLLALLPASAGPRAQAERRLPRARAR